jgi:hypothetical protein
MAEIAIALSLFFGHCRRHLVAIIAMEGITLNKGGRNLFTPENLFKGAPDGCRPSSRGSGHGYDRMFRGHVSLAFSFSFLASIFSGA